MIGYVTLGTKNMEKAAKFYDELLTKFDAKRVMDMGRFIGWGSSHDKPMLAVTEPYDKQEQHHGNGNMVALHAKNRAHVDEVYNKALELGGTCEGKPGVRGGTFYAAYFRDLDGNKLNAFYMGE